MIVRRRTKEIGILMAIGVTDESIIKIFLLESLLLCLPAKLLGVFVKLGFAETIALCPIDIPSASSGVTWLMIDLRPEFLIHALIFALLLNVNGSIYPANMASRLDPIEAIKND